MKPAGKLFFKNLLLREIIVILGIIFLGGFVFWKVEGMRFINAIYFTVITITTIGYGDITPQTDIGKIFAMIYAFMGVPIFVSLSGLILETRFNKRLKYYISSFHKELHKAEAELQEVEAKVEDELGDIMRQGEKTEIKVDQTAKGVKVNRKKIEKIEELIQEEIVEKHPRRRIWKRDNK